MGAIGRIGFTTRFLDPATAAMTFPVHVTATAGKLEGQVETRIWEKMPQEFAELVQHEIDHLDGVLMSDRAVEESQPISRQEYEQNRYKYDAMVDYVIQPTS
jgi:hypothetical protein